MGENAIQLHVEWQLSAFSGLRHHLRTNAFCLDVNIFHPLVVEVVTNLQVNLFGKLSQLWSGKLFLHTRIALNESKRNPLRIVQMRMLRFDGSSEACYLLFRVFRKRKIAIRLAHKLAIHHFFDGKK